jgi:CMP-N,N'-diacetyllegionaminic acid synthase
LSYKGKSVLAIVPARGGSKGIPWKNLCKVGGKTLVRRAIEIALATPEIDRVVCSTNRERIAVEAYSAGAEIRKRPNALAGDYVGDAPVLRDVAGHEDIIVMLQPTSPLRQIEDVSRCIRMLVDDERDSVWTVSETDLHYHPLKQLSYKFARLTQPCEIIARQDLAQTYTRNGVCYAMTRHCLNNWGTMGANCGALILEGEHVSIDTERDLELAERLLNG